MEKPEHNPLSASNFNSSEATSFSWLSHLPVLMWQTNVNLVVENMIGALIAEFEIDISKILQKTLWELEEKEENNKWIFSAQYHADTLLGQEFYSILTHNNRFYRLQITAIKAGKKLIGTAGMITQIHLSQPNENAIDSSIDSTNDALIYKCVELLPSPSLIFSAADNKIQVANEHFIKGFKYSTNPIIGQPITKLISSNDLTQIRTRIRRRGAVRTFDIKMRREDKDNKRRFFWVKVAVQMMEIADKKYFLLQFTDITKSRQNEEKWRSLIKFAPDYILHVDLEGNIQYINRTPTQTSIAEMMGRNVYDMLVEQEKDSLKEVFKYVQTTKDIGRFESMFYNYVTKSRTTWLSVRIAPMVTDEEVTGFALIASDITRAKRNQEQLSQSESKNKALLATIPDQIFLISENGTILDYKADQQDHYKFESPIHQKIKDVFRTMVADKVEEAILETVRTKKSQSLQYDHLTEQDELLHLEARTNLGSKGEILMIVRNITEQKRNEIAITKNRQEYKQLLNNIDEIVYAVGINPNTDTYQLTFVSEHLQSVLNYPLNYFDKGFFPWIRVIHPEDRREVLQTMQEAVRKQTKTARTFRILHHTEKKYLWLEERINPQVDNLGNLTGFLGVARDITYEKIAKEEKLRLISLIGSSHEFIGLTDKEGIIKFINEAGAKLLGFEKSNETQKSHEKIIDTSILEYFTRSSQEKIKMEVFQFPRYESWETELRIINRRKYMPLDVAVSFFPIKLNETHEATSIAVVMRDISERKRSERKIKQSEQKYRTLIDTMREGIIVLNSADEIVYVNERVLELLGHIQSELEGKTMDKLLFSKDIDTESHEILKKRSKINPEQYELQLRRKSNESLWAWISSNPIKADNIESLGTILAIADINSLKIAQNELVSLNKEMEQLLYRASHDLKGPISSIQGVLNLFKMEKTEDQTVQQYTNMIQVTVNKLSDLIEDLTKVSSIKQGKLKLKIIDFEPLITSIIDTFSFYENYENIKFGVQVNCKKEFCTDEGLLYTIIQNFVENGIKYSKRYFDNSLVQITVKDTAKGIEMVFVDNGIGIPKQQQTAIFEMFVRVTDQAKGSGLGLYIVDNAIKKLHGTMHLESEENEGSIFTIRLPHMEM